MEDFLPVRGEFKQRAVFVIMTAHALFFGLEWRAGSRIIYMRLGGAMAILTTHVDSVLGLRNIDESTGERISGCVALLAVWIVLAVL